MTIIIVNECEHRGCHAQQGVLVQRDGQGLWMCHKHAEQFNQGGNGCGTWTALTGNLR